MFGTGVDVVYPRKNSRPSEQILSFGGALVFCRPAELPDPQSHHQQNFFSECWWLELRNIVAHALRFAVLWSRITTRTLFRGM